MIVRSPRKIANYRRLSKSEMSLNGLGSAATPTTSDLSEWFGSFMSDDYAPGSVPTPPASTAPKGTGWDGLPATGSGLCIVPTFPWVGQKAAGSVACSPVLDIPSPWGMILTAGVAFLVLKKVTE